MDISAFLNDIGWPGKVVLFGLFTLWLLDKAENITSSDSKVWLSKRLKRIEVKEPGERWYDLFIQIFDEVYAQEDKIDPKAVPAIRVGRSVITSLIFVVAFAIVIPGAWPEPGIGFILFLALPINLVADYYSLSKSRRVLEWLSRRGGAWQIGLPVFDLIVSLLIFAGMFTIFLLVALFFVSSPDLVQVFPAVENSGASGIMWKIALAPAMAIKAVYLMIFAGQLRELMPFMLSTCVASCWVFLHILSESVVRICTRSEKLLNTLKWLLPIDTRPLSALGVVAAILIIVIGWVIGIIYSLLAG